MRGELDVHGRRHNKDSTLGSKSGTALIGVLNFLGRLFRSGYEVAQSGALNLLGNDIVPEGIQSLVIEEKPRGKCIISCDVSFENID